MAPTRINAADSSHWRFAMIAFLLVALFHVGASALHAGEEQSILKAGHGALKLQSIMASADVKQVSPADVAVVHIEVTQEDVAYEAGRTAVLARRDEVEVLLQSLTQNSSTISHHWQPSEQQGSLDARGPRSFCGPMYCSGRKANMVQEYDEDGTTTVSAGFRAKVEDVTKLQDFAQRLMDDESVKFSNLRWTLSKDTKAAVRRGLTRQVVEELSRTAREYEEDLGVHIVSMEELRNLDFYENMGMWDEDEQDAMDYFDDWKDFFKVSQRAELDAAEPKVGTVTSHLHAECKLRLE